MPTTRAARRAAAERQFLELPTDVLGLVLYQLPLAHDIAATALTCRTFHASAKLVQKLRPFTGKVVTLVTPDVDLGLRDEIAQLRAQRKRRVRGLCVPVAPAAFVIR